MSILIVIVLALVLFAGIVAIAKMYRQPHNPPIILFVGKTFRTIPTVRFFEIFDVSIPDAIVAKMVASSSSKLIAFSPEMLSSKLVVDKVPAILTDCYDLIEFGWHRFLNGGSYCKDIDQVMQQIGEVAQVRVSASCLIRLKWGKCYVLMRYKKNNADGSPRFIPLGGVLQHYASTTLKQMGAFDFKNANDLRFTLPSTSLRDFANWFEKRIHRETTPWRELKEELVFELGVMSCDEFDRYASHQ